MSDILNSKGAGNLMKVNEMIEKELNEEINKINIELNEKIIENEKYQQELHELRNKLKACLATQKELTQANELMEENLTLEQAASKKKINSLLEKFAVEKKQYEERISELETSLLREENTNKELRETLNAKEKLSVTVRSDLPDKAEENFILKEKIKSLFDDLEKQGKITEELVSRQQELEETNATLKKNYNEVRDILEVKKVDFQSLKEVFETTKDELVVCRSELESLRAVPRSDSVKGNSLFAEVDDNRQKVINDVTVMKKQYLHMKQTYDAKEKEIRTLKIEKANLLKTLAGETVVTVDQCARLIQTYKSRILELENRLKMQERKQNIEDTEQPVDENFSYLQSLLTAKKKEIEELINKLERSSIEKILQEEIKYDIEKQLRQWKYKAMSYQAQLSITENQTKCEECLKIKPKDSGDSERKQPDCQSTEITGHSLMRINRCETNFEKFLQIHNVPAEKGNRIVTDHSRTEDVRKSEDNVQSVELHESIYMDETLPISQKPVSLTKSISDDKSKKENNASCSNANETILKSALAKSDGNSSDFMGEEKIKKNLRFTTDTVDPERTKLTRQNTEQKTYPVVFISSNQSNK